MARAFKNMQKRAARGRRSTVNATMFARMEQLEMFAFEVASAILNDKLSEEDAKEACAEYQRYVQEVNRGK